MCFICPPAPSSRCTKTRSYDNLPSACEVGGSLPANRRSSDPNLNDKWQDHRRSLEINVAAAPDEGGDQEQEETWPNGSGEDPQADGGEGGDSESDDSPPPRDSQAEPLRVCCVSPPEVEEEELSAVGGAMGQVEKMVHEETTEKTTASADVEEEGGASCTLLRTTVDQQGALEDLEEKEEPLSPPVNGTLARGEDLVNGHDTEEPEEPEDGQPAPPADCQEAARSTSEDDGTTSPAENSSGQEEAPPPSGPCQAKHRTLLTNGFTDGSPKESDHGVLEVAPPLESSTETLTEDGYGRAELRLAHQSQPQETGENGCGSRTLNGLAPRPAAVLPPACNGEQGPLNALPSSRQAVASSSSYSYAPRGVCSLHRCCHAANRPAISPEQSGRGHLDDDGLTLHADVVQQRLRQIEAGHQMEVETLKKQLQELWSRLENQQYGGAHRLNGDMGDDLVGAEPPGSCGGVGGGFLI